MFDLQGQKDDGRAGLAGIMDSLSMPNIFSLSSAIDSVKANLQAKVGLFLQNDLSLLNANAAISKMYSGATPALRVVLDALAAQSAALKRNQDSLMDGATILGSQLMDFKTRMQTTSPIKEVLAGTISTAQAVTTASLPLVLSIAKDGSALMKKASQQMETLDEQNKGVALLVSQVEATRAAQGGSAPLPSVADILVQIKGTVAGVSSTAWLLGGTALLFAAAFIIGMKKR